MSEQQAEQGIKLSDELLERVEARLPYTEFESVDEYVEFVVGEVLTNVEESAVQEGEGVDEDVVQDRLKSLGYLNE